MNFFSKTLLVLLILSFFSCDSSDNETPEERNENNLVLKSITAGTNGTLTVNFDEKGRFLFAEDSRFLTPKLSEAIYDENDRKKKFISYTGGGDTNVIIDYFYDSEGKITKITQDYGNFPSSPPKSTVNLSYQGNVVTSTALQDDVEKHRLTFSFNNNDLEQLEKLEVFDISANQKVFEEVYEYSANGNLTKNTVVLGADQTNTSNSFTYDNKKNGYTEGNRQFYLNEVLLLDRPNSLVTQLTLLTPNNLTSPVSGEGTVALEYNEKDYPIKETTTNNNETYIRIFEYY